MLAVTKELQYAPMIERRSLRGPESLGLMVAHAYAEDPKRLGFTAARYKFVAKMLSGRGRVLEVGCVDAFFSRTVLQEVGSLTAIDFDPLFVANARSHVDSKWPMEIVEHDMVRKQFRGPFDAVYALDVLEHIRPEDERQFLANCVISMGPYGVAIFGMPSLESQALASPQSRQGHVNCKSGPQLKACLEEHFHNVFLFSMNDEVVHTGHYAMAHYLLALCAHPRGWE